MRRLAGSTQRHDDSSEPAIFVGLSRGIRRHAIVVERQRHDDATAVQKHQRETARRRAIARALAPARDGRAPDAGSCDGKARRRSDARDCGRVADFSALLGQRHSRVLIVPGLRSRRGAHAKTKAVGAHVHRWRRFITSPSHDRLVVQQARVSLVWRCSCRVLGEWYPRQSS